MNINTNKISSIMIVSFFSLICVTSIGKFGVSKLKHIKKNSVVTTQTPEVIIAQNEIIPDNKNLQEFNLQEIFKIEKVINFGNSIVNQVNNMTKTYIPKKSMFSKLDSVWSYFFTGQIFSSQIIKGSEGWLFYNGENSNDGQSIKDYEGKNFYTDTQLAQIKSILTNISESINNSGAEFCYVIAPNKSQIYPEYMDKHYTFSKYSSADQLQEYLKNNGINAVYLKNELLRKKETLPLYYKYDSHWNGVGGHIGARMILKSFGIELNDITVEDIKLVSSSRISDLPGLCGLESIYNNDEEYSVYGDIAVDALKYMETNNSKSCYFQENPDAELDKTLLMIGDSYRTGIVPAMSKIFKRVYEIHREGYTTDLFATAKPDYVVIEYVERYSHKIFEQPAIVK